MEKHRHMPPFDFFMAAHRHHGRRFRHGPPPWVFDMMGGHRRAERGEIRYLILDAVKDGPRHGYDIIQTIEKRAGGGYRPSPGTVYPTLQMLEEMGQVTASEAEGRRVYTITDAGRAELESHQDEVEEAYDRLGEDADWDEFPDVHQLFARIPRLVRTIGRGFRRGRISPRQFNQIHDVLDHAIEEIEGILSGKKH